MALSLFATKIRIPFSSKQILIKWHNRYLFVSVPSWFISSCLVLSKRGWWNFCSSMVNRIGVKFNSPFLCWESVWNFFPGRKKWEIRYQLDWLWSVLWNASAVRESRNDFWVPEIASVSVNFCLIYLLRYI